MKRITAERERRGWSKSELARRAAMNNSTVGLIERGLSVPYPSQLKKLAAALDIPEDQAPTLLDEVTMEVRDARAAA